MVHYDVGPKGLYLALEGKQRIGWARVHPANYISGLYVHRAHRRKKVATGLIAFVAAHRQRKLDRAPAHTKTQAVKLLSAKLGDALGPEVVESNV